MYLPKVKTCLPLAPISWLYGFGVWCRNLMFDRGILRQESFEDKVAVISVGNLAVGGTGKTPHTEYIVRLLKSNGIGPIAVLSRGYKRQSRGFVLAGPDITATKLGDESFQIYRKFPDVIVAVDENRRDGIRKLLKLPVPPKVIILDDAMQHRYVKPGLSICLTSHNRIMYKDSLLPMGRLREPMQGIERADVVVVTKCPGPLRQEEEVEIKGYLPTTHQPIFYSAYRYNAPVNLDTGLPTELDHATQVLAVTGIADPSVLQGYVQTHYRLLDIISYGDHHRFSNEDIKEMQRSLDNINVDGFCTNHSGTQSVILTTEKDAARLLSQPAIDQNLRKRIYYLPTEVLFLKDHGEKFDKIILDYVNKKREGGRV